MQEILLFEQKSNGSAFSDICKSIKCDFHNPGWPDKFGAAVKNYLKANKITEIRTLKAICSFVKKQRLRMAGYPVCPGRRSNTSLQSKYQCRED